MKQRLKPERIEGHKITGRIVKSTKNELKFKIVLKNRELDSEFISRLQSVENTKYNFFQKPYFDNLPINLIYLNQESLRGMYKNPEMNLPYEILSSGNNLLYRQDALIRKKKDIFGELEKAAFEEGLRD